MCWGLRCWLRRLDHSRRMLFAPGDGLTLLIAVGMLLMPLFFARLGVKWMLLVGMGAWVARYGLFAAAADNRVLWMVFLGVLLHGICYDFFFVTGMIYVDKRASVDIRHQAQGFLVLVTQGLGLGLGSNTHNENGPLDLCRCTIPTPSSLLTLMAR